MDRELRRVSLDFDYPLNEAWYGFFIDSIPTCVTTDNSHKCEQCKKMAAIKGIPFKSYGCPDFDTYLKEIMNKLKELLVPPKGNGYQLWETTSEGSPVSPVFETLDELCEWCEKNVTKQLILGIRMLAESLGYTTSVSYCKRPVKHIIEGRIVNQHDTYSVAICNNGNRRTGIEHDKHKWYKCRDVIKTGETKTVYNISVEEDESYIADNIVVHNCQDLSVTGKQSGIKLKCETCGTIVEFADSTHNCPNCGAELDFTRSVLFMEQIRIIREMREKTNECYPKIVIWENVSSALSSNNGDDFFCVLQEFCKFMAKRIPAFRPESWSNAGEILGESCSIAWRVLDAQYWGDPQRRRRIFLVADFGGQRAGEILFKSESLRRHLTSSTAP